jgi:hypothetical protein
MTTLNSGSLPDPQKPLPLYRVLHEECDLLHPEDREPGDEVADGTVPPAELGRESAATTTVRLEAHR